VGEETFGVNDFISVNHSNITNGEQLTTEDESHFWIARVLEIRAKDSQNVYLRVFWMYWAHELPMGAQSYHGKDELIASNQMDIIDAMTVASKASVSHWLEKDEEKVLDALYWRQTFNFQTQTLSVSILSAPPRIRLLTMHNRSFVNIVPANNPTTPTKT
jgi:hypothetical protein